MNIPRVWAYGECGRVREDDWSQGCLVGQHGLLGPIAGMRKVNQHAESIHLLDYFAASGSETTTMLGSWDHCSGFVGGY
jgi:hypothetical protein